jgi:hypothetical protein
MRPVFARSPFPRDSARKKGLDEVARHASTLRPRRYGVNVRTSELCSPSPRRYPTFATTLSGFGGPFRRGVSNETTLNDLPAAGGERIGGSPNQATWSEPAQVGTQASAGV